MPLLAVLHITAMVYVHLSGKIDANPVRKENPPPQPHTCQPHKTGWCYQGSNERQFLTIIHIWLPNWNTIFHTGFWWSRNVPSCILVHILLRGKTRQFKSNLTSHKSALRMHGINYITEPLIYPCPASYTCLIQLVLALQQLKNTLMYQGQYQRASPRLRLGSYTWKSQCRVKLRSGRSHNTNQLICSTWPLKTHKAAMKNNVHPSPGSIHCTLLSTACQC